MLCIASCIAAYDGLRNDFCHILLVIMLIDVPAYLGFHYSSIFLFSTFFVCVLLVLLAAIDFVTITKDMLCNVNFKAFFLAKVNRTP